MSLIGRQKLRSIEPLTIHPAGPAECPAPRGRVLKLFSRSALRWYGRWAAVGLVLAQLVGSIRGGAAWAIDSPAQSALGLAGGLLALGSLAAASRASIQQSRQARLAWAVLLAAAAGLTLGRLSRLVALFLPFGEAPGSLFDWAFAGLFFCGTFLLPTERNRAHGLARLALDISIVVLSSLFTTWMYFLSPYLVAGQLAEPVTWLVQIAPPLGDLLILWAVILLVSRHYPAHFRSPTHLLACAGAAVVLSDAIHVGLLSAPFLSPVLWPGLLQILAASLLFLAGALQRSLAEPPGEPEGAWAPGREPAAFLALRLSAPTIWVGLVYLLFIITPVFRSLGSRVEMSFWVAGIIGLVIARQVIELGENQRLDHALRELNGRLDELVAVRTAELTRANEALRQEMADQAHIEQILREREEAMERAAMHDALTDLPNRLLLMEHLRQAIRKIQRWDEYGLALLFIDFDDFKCVNDRLGHLVGDQVLIAVAQRLRRYVREIDTVARLGGDEFVVLLADGATEKGVTPAVQRIHDLLAEPYEIGSQKIRLSASIGVVISDKSYQQPSDFLRDADLAMYEAKAQGKGRHVIFSPEMRSHALERLVIEDDLRAALNRNEMVLHYHPILSLATGHITGFEALVRWRHPQRGLIPPDSFIPIAETSHLIVPLTRWVILEACAQLKKWQTDHPQDSQLTISVNMSPVLFAQPSGLAMVEEALAETGLAPHFLRLEITEGAISADSENIKTILQGWRERGIQVQMDDFGTGYASLSYLHRFPIDALKIDRSFIQPIRPNGEQGEIARTVTSLSRELNLEVIAEGVETIEQLAFLKILGCQYAQGFLITRPLPSEDVQPFLRSFTGVPGAPQHYLH